MRRGHRARLFSPILWAFVLGLLVRAILPAGVMVDTQSPGAPILILCTGQGPVEVEFDGDRYRPVHHHHHPAPADHHHGGECPFAGGHVFTPPVAVADPVARAYAWLPVAAPTPRERSPALGLRAPPPPSHAPPIILS